MIDILLKVFGCFLNSASQEEKRVLLNAAHLGDVDTVRQLLDETSHLAVINCMNEYGSSPLVLASLKGHALVVEVLLQHGANVNQTGPWNWTPLHAACYFGHTAVVQHLLAADADVNAMNHDMKVPGSEFDYGVDWPVRRIIQQLLNDHIANIPQSRIPEAVISPIIPDPVQGVPLPVYCAAQTTSPQRSNSFSVSPAPKPPERRSLLPTLNPEPKRSEDDKSDQGSTGSRAGHRRSRTDMTGAVGGIGHHRSRSDMFGNVVKSPGQASSNSLTTWIEMEEDAGRDQSSDPGRTASETPSQALQVRFSSQLNICETADSEHRCSCGGSIKDQQFCCQKRREEYLAARYITGVKSKITQAQIIKAKSLGTGGTAVLSSDGSRQSDIQIKRSQSPEKDKRKNRLHTYPAIFSEHQLESDKRSIDSRNSDNGIFVSFKKRISDNCACTRNPQADIVADAYLPQKDPIR